jgi:hypothetical protein
LNFAHPRMEEKLSGVTKFITLVPEK